MPQTSTLAIVIFLAFTGFTLGLSFWLGRKATSSAGYFAAHGQIGWFVNGVAFAGDYLSAASFLGICGMIAFYGYDGFLYSIGYLAGWVVALFVIAEPIKRLGKYTFADALNAKFQSRGITLAAAVSTLVVSVFYLIPQMVGAGALMKALLSLPEKMWHGIDLNHALGVSVVGAVVIAIVTTAGMVSTTWVQFIKGSLLVVFCLVLTGMILNRGLRSKSVPPVYIEIMSPRTLYVVSGSLPPESRIQVERLDPIGSGRSNEETGPLGPSRFVSTLSDAGLIRWAGSAEKGWTGDSIRGSDVLLPGGSPTFAGIRSPNLVDRLDFVSLMLALFCGTASLPHILIRYYTVKDAAAARKSTVVGIGAIGFFYILTLYIGLGAMVSGNLSADSNMAAPLLAATFGPWPFALITAIAFTTVLGTVSGLILASAGAVAHDLRGVYLARRRNAEVRMLNAESHSSFSIPPSAFSEDDGRRQVRVAKIASVAVGLVAIVLGIYARDFNVTFLVGWAFNVAASANLPAIVMLLFWRGTTRQGIVASIVVGLASSLAWLLLSGPAFANLYGLPAARALVPFSQPGLVTIPLSFAVLVIVSLATKREARRRGFDVQ